MNKVLINYADRSHYHSQIMNSKSGLEIGGFTHALSLGISHVDQNYYEKNKHIFIQPRGAGYWVWKPYIIRKALDTINENDILFYCDAGVIFIRSIDPLIEIMDNTKEKLLLFDLEDANTNIRWTKRDCFVILDADTDYYWHKNQIISTYLIMRKNDFVIDFINEWMKYAQDYRAITDSPNECGLPNYPEFVDHRHDQSILCLLGLKHKIKVIPDVTNYGKGRWVTKEQLLWHHRCRW